MPRPGPRRLRPTGGAFRAASHVPIATCRQSGPAGTLQDDLLRKDRSRAEAFQPVGGEIERRSALDYLLGDGAADGRRLHEPVAGEAAGGVDALADPADDRMRVRAHVVEPRPRPSDAGAPRGREAAAEPL